MNRAEQIARRLLENNEGDVEEIATDWISGKEPRYIIEGGFMVGGRAINYDGRLFVYNPPQWTPVNKWVTFVLFGPEKLTWEQARQKLESGETYFGWLRINVSIGMAGEEIRQAWFANQPVKVRKIPKE